MCVEMNVATVSIALETPLLRVGEFRCPPADRAWRTRNLIGDRPHVVFPRVPVLIQHEGSAPLLTAPTHTVLYNAEEHYRRELRNARGDDCVFVELTEESLEQLAAAGATLVDGRNRLVTSHAPVDRDTYLLQHLLIRHLRSTAPDRLLAEEAAARLVLRALRPSVRPSRARAHRSLVEAAKAELATPETAAPLHEIARRLHTSAFHLARVFRAETGFSLHGFRQAARLRTALERLSAHRNDLTRLAVELGFSSHSHFTERFRSEFGVAPSEVRDEGHVRALLVVAARR
jgi:AraC-like DNA-binding protein